MSGVLFVEHDRDSLCKFANLLTAAAHTVFIAYDRVSLQYAFQQHGPRFTMAVSDVLFRHPGDREGVNAFPQEIYDDVLRENPALPIVALTGQAQPFATLEKLRESAGNVVACVMKTDGARLLRVVAHILQAIATDPSLMSDLDKVQGLIDALRSL